MVEQVAGAGIARSLLGLHVLRIDDATDRERQDREEPLRARGLRHAHDDRARIRRLDAVGLELRDVREQEGWRLVELDHALQRVHDVVRGERVPARELHTRLQLEGDVPLRTGVLDVPALREARLDRRQVGALELHQGLVDVVDQQNPAEFVRDRGVERDEVADVRVVNERAGGATSRRLGGGAA